ncbi:MAG: hypothetical protein ACKOTA_00510, partial [Solirubrobacterales bacterium]
MTRSTALIIALVIAGGAVAAVLLVNGGGGGSGDTPALVTTGPLETGTVTVPTTTTTTSDKPDSVQVEATVTSYVSAAEEGDATAVCNLQVDGQGSGATSAQACASKAGINLEQLPALSRLKVQDVRVDGDRATASLGRFGEFTLVKSSGQWKVSGFKATPARPAAGSGGQSGSSGGTSGGSSSGGGGAERQDSGGTAAPSGTGGASAP